MFVHAVETKGQQIPKGTYEGDWSGFEVTLKLEGTEYKLHTEKERGGVDWHNCCWVIVSDKGIFVTKIHPKT